MPTQLVKRDLPVAIHVHPTNHFVHIGESVARKTVLVQLSTGDHSVDLIASEHTISLNIQDTKTLPKEAAERLAEKSDAAGSKFSIFYMAVGVNVKAQHVGLSISRLDAQIPERGQQLRSGDVAVPLRVSQAEDLPHTAHLCRVKLRGDLQHHNLFEF